MPYANPALLKGKGRRSAANMFKALTKDEMKDACIT